MSFYGSARRSIRSGLETFATQYDKFWGYTQEEQIRPGSDEYGELTTSEKIGVHAGLGDSHIQNSKRSLVFGALATAVAVRTSTVDHVEFIFAVSSGISVYNLGKCVMGLHGARTEYNTADTFRAAGEMANIAGLATASPPEQV